MSNSGGAMAVSHSHQRQRSISTPRTTRCRATTPCEADLDFNAARTLVEEINASDSGGRVARLLELSEMLPSEGLIGFEGSAGQFLFEDVKATWLYGCFTPAVLTANPCWVHPPLRRA